MNEIPKVDSVVTKKIVTYKETGTQRNVDLLKEITNDLMSIYGFDYDNERQLLKDLLGMSAKQAGNAIFNGVITQEQYNLLYRKAQGFDTE